jgi:sarcosine oxidase
MTRFDVIVAGLGAMGSAALCQLAGRGAKVLGLDRHAPPHKFGSSHGETRITRLAIGEGAHYTPLVQRSHELWREIERETGADLMTTTGGLIISSDGPTADTHVANFYGNTLAAAEACGIAHEILDARAIRQRFPAFHVADDEFGYFERDAGFLRPETCIATQLALAQMRGAEIRTGEILTAFEADAGGVTATTDRGRYHADRLILSIGAWLPGLLTEELSRSFKVYRQVLFWFEIEGPVEPFLPENFPVFIWSLKNSTQGVYGFPALNGREGGLKISTEQYLSSTSADAVDRHVGPAEIAAMYENLVAPNIPALGRRCLKTETCLYTVTPDAGFVIDRHPESDRVTIVSACSGHGFKHSPAIGEALTEMALDGRTTLDLGPFGIARFRAGT